MDQAHAGRLYQIIERLATVAVAAGDVFGEWQTAFYDCIALVPILD